MCVMMLEQKYRHTPQWRAFNARAHAPTPHDHALAIEATAGDLTRTYLKIADRC